MIVEVLTLTAIVVFIVDLSGFADTLLSVMSKITGKKVTEFKPFTCSLCMTFWVGLVYIIINGFSLWNLALVCLCSLLSMPIGNLLQGLKFILTKLIDKLND